MKQRRSKREFMRREVVAEYEPTVIEMLAAVEGIPGGGTITIRTSLINPDNSLIVIEWEV